MIASIRAISPSSISAFLQLLGHARAASRARSGAGPSSCTCCIWSRKSSSVNWPSAQLLLGLAASRPASKVGLGLLDEREHVAHAEDAARHAVGVERLEVVELLAGTREEDRLADDLLHRQRGATARVAVDLGEDHAVEADRLVERLGDVHRFLAGHGVDDEQRVVRLHRVADLRAARPSARRRSARRPAVSTITTSRPRRCGLVERAARRPSTGSVGSLKTRHVDAARRARAAARPRPGAAGRRRRAAGCGPAP